MVTEAVRLHAPQLVQSSIWEAEDIGGAIVWITDQGMDLAARVLGLKELQELRGLKQWRGVIAGEEMELDSRSFFASKTYR